MLWTTRFVTAQPRRKLSTMGIDIDTLTEAELIDLNHRIVARLRVLRDMRAHVGMLDFRIGDRVTFQPPGRRPLEGVLTRYNRKTVTVITDDGGQWNVSPVFLGKTGATADTRPDTTRTNVVLLNRR
jgi:hypothetical protein